MGFSYVRNFRSLRRVYSIQYAFFIILLICSLKFNFESIVIPGTVTDEIDFMVIYQFAMNARLCFLVKQIENFQDLLSLNCKQTIHIRFTYLV